MGKDSKYKAVYPPLPNWHGEALKICITVLQKLGFSGDVAWAGPLAEKLVRLARQDLFYKFTRYRNGKWIFHQIKCHVMV